MSKTIIFMNEQLHAKKPKHGVITVKQGRKKWYGNKIELHSDCSSQEPYSTGFRIVVAGPCVTVLFDPRGCPAIRTHKVVAWIEVD